MLGLSRKRFIKDISKENDTKERLGGTISSCIQSYLQGVQINKIAENETNTKWNECFSNAYKNIEECIIEKKVNKCDINSALQVHKILDDIKNEK